LDYHGSVSWAIENPILVYHYLRLNLVFYSREKLVNYGFSLSALGSAPGNHCGWNAITRSREGDFPFISTCSISWQQVLIQILKEHGANHLN